ncbi:MAG: hypothetical protein J6K43_11280 [Lachnospiraceae bacterium]|nr:hypothetical protein [Lachnospiraceae bacterium]
MKKKRRIRSKLSLFLALMLLCVMLMPTTVMAEEATTRQEFDNFGPGDGKYVLHVKVSATDGVDDGYVDFGIVGPNQYKTYGNESKYIFNKEDTTSYYTLSLVPGPGKKLTYYKVVYDTRSTFEYGTSTGYPISYEDDGSVEITITEPMTSQVDNNKVYIEATFEDAQAPGEPTNIRWEGKTVKWDAPASGVDFYIVRVGYGSYFNGEWETIPSGFPEITTTGREFNISNVYPQLLDDAVYSHITTLYITAVKDRVRSEMVHSEPYAQHDVPDDYSYDEDYHWKKCTVCGIAICYEEHDFGRNGFCSVCGYTGTPYKFLEGANGIYTLDVDSKLSFRADGAFNKFLGVKVDGVEITSDKYTATEGSTIIELKKDYLNTLSVGKHTLTVIYTDGSCTTNFEIKKKVVSTESTTAENTTTESTTAATDNTPKTGDSVDVTMLLALIALSGMSALALVTFGKKKHL